MIPSRFLYNFSIPCIYREDLTSLDRTCRLVDFTSLENQPVRGKLEVFAAWNQEGLAFQFSVSGKKKRPICQPNCYDNNDGIQLWLDMRDIRNAHRGSRYCHQFFLYPCGGGDNGESPLCILYPMNRAKENPHEIPEGSVKIHSHISTEGYILYVHFSSRALTGYYPDEHKRLGIAWQRVDRELGSKTLTADSPFPFYSDPSLWYTLELI